MMDKWQAIHNMWSSFGIPAYDENTVPDDAVMPYITYSMSVGSFEQPISLYCSVWHHSTSWEAISQKVNEIAEYFNGLRTIKVEGGYLAVSQGTPFAQRMSDDNTTTRRIYINIDAEFYTEV